MIRSTDIATAMLEGLSSATTGGSPLDPMANAYEFALRYRPNFDGVDIGAGLLGDWSHLKDLYQNTRRKQVVMASAQSGKTGWLCVALSRELVGSAWGRLVGFYFPDKELPIKYGRDRIKPLFKSSPDLAPLIGTPLKDGSKGVDAALTMNVGATMLYLMTIGGRTSTEGVPLKGIAFDEVRRMSIGDIERAHQRYSAQVEPFDFKVSTPGYPDSTIDLFFQNGDQRYFHTECECADGIVLPLRWPDCIGDMRSATPQLRAKVEHAFHAAGMPFCGMSESQAREYPAAFYRCPTCGAIITNPRRGWWEPHNPRAFIRSWQFGKMLSPVSPPGRVLQVFELSKDRTEFFNSELGLPHLDQERRPIKASHIDACVDRDLTWAVRMDARTRDRKIVNTSMGVDVQAGYGIAVVKQWAPNGKRRVVHAEVVHMENPRPDRTWWHRLGVMMRYFDVRFAVIDEQPEYTQTLAFSKAFPGRVYLANYHLSAKAPRFIAWEDEALAGDDKQLGDHTDIRHRVSMDRTRALHWSLHLWKDRMNEIPSLDSLTQLLPHQGGKPVFSPHLEVGARDAAATAVPRILQDHLTRFVFRNVLDSDETPKKRTSKPLPNQVGQVQWVAEHIGTSPDFAHANLYADVGLERIGQGRSG